MKAKKDILSNGIRVISIEDRNTQAVTVSVLVKTGSRNEDIKTYGLSHFLEHMVFKGTKKRPSPKIIAEEADKIGAQMNAFTDKEVTGFWLKARKKHFEEITDLLFDVVFEAEIKESEIERERGVIFEEIKMYEDNPMYWVRDLFERLIYKGTNMENDIIGYRKTLKKIKRADFIEYRSKFYGNKNLVIAVAGNLPKDFLAVFEEKLKNIKEVEDNDWKKEGQLSFGKKVLLYYKDIGQTNIALGFLAPGYTSEEFYKLYLLKTILGSGMSSPLFSEVREKRGLAYAVSADISGYSDPGFLMVYAGVSADKTEESIKVIIKVLKDIKEKISEEDLKRAKEQLASYMVYKLEESFEAAVLSGKRELYGLDLFSLEEIINKIESITMGDVQELARKIIDFENVSLVLVGPHKDKAKFENIIKDI